ncbi:hypothetical protein [Hymenobacter persicinus]|uniref:Uncharacterized protein n=1 Tax=Hymenobacter persicinus TaxID=2025506 RepID=A0A4V1ZB64_9BACT|nr:hypothetical protein [Hymenobacter persicinus]RYU83318.1 hypothetical protein EWM57_03260 [Hymenobacter persicinus]
MLNVNVPVRAHVERTADRLLIAITAAISPIPWRMELLRTTWKSLGTALSAAYVADCYLSAHPHARPRLDRACLVSVIQLTMPAG